MERLPPEILDMVLDYCSQTELKNLRLTGSTISKVVLRHLYGWIRVVAHPQSFKNLLHLSRHPDIKHCVRRVTYDTRMLPTTASSFHWLGTGLCDPEADARLQKSYELFVEYKERQKSIGKTFDDLNEFKKAFARLPGLSHFSLVSGNSPSVESEFAITDTDDFAECRRTMECVPCAAGGWDMHNAKTLSFLQAVPSLRQPLSSLDLSCVQWHFLDCTQSKFKKLCQNMAGLRKLVLGIKIPDMDHKGEFSQSQIKNLATRISTFVHGSSKLESLTLSIFRPCDISRRLLHGFEFHQRSVESSILEALADISEGTPRKWPLLRKLTLHNLKTLPEHLYKILGKCAASLTHLHLDTIYLYDGCWLKVLRMIPKVLKGRHLEQFKLLRELRSDDEYYETEYPDTPCQVQNCLRRQIERWVECGGQGPFPFLPEFDPPCTIHWQPTLSRLQEIKLFCRAHVNQGDSSFLWRYDKLTTLPCSLSGCPSDCDHRSEGHLDPDIDGDGFVADDAEHEDHHHFNRLASPDDPDSYGIDFASEWERQRHRRAYEGMYLQRDGDVKVVTSLGHRRPWEYDSDESDDWYSDGWYSDEDEMDMLDYMLEMHPELDESDLEDFFY
ncbi:MAG: hypothetical protein Q9227_003786 [Pyrenula ochraceoflavens]